MRLFLIIHFVLLPFYLVAQADNEIQVYASPTISKNWTIFELHSNYTFQGSKYLANPKSARVLNETLEITHGFGNNFEIGFYTFTSIGPQGIGFQYHGNQIRPRLTVPERWGWKMGASLSLEFGFFRPDDSTDFYWQGELRPIIDKTMGSWYWSFNPNIDFVLSGASKGVGIAPQFKLIYNLGRKLGIGFEYYGSLGEVDDILSLHQQEHLLGPMIDLYLHPMWELNGGFLFGLTENSNQQIFKLLLGRRIKKK